jgi:hypothetical protein
MDFQTKIELIEDARLKYQTFEDEFRDYLSAGHSFNGAYNFFSVEDVEKHKKLSETKLELDAWSTLHGGSKDSSPVRLASESVKEKLERLDDSVNKPSGNKGLPKHKVS